MQRHLLLKQPILQGLHAMTHLAALIRHSEIARSIAVGIVFYLVLMVLLVLVLV